MPGPARSGGSGYRQEEQERDDDLTEFFAPRCSNCPWSPREVERHIGQNDAILEEQGGLQQQGTLIMQNVLPPAGRQNFGDDDRNPAFEVFVQEFFDVAEQRSENR